MRASLFVFFALLCLNISAQDELQYKFLLEDAIAVKVPPDFDTMSLVKIQEIYSSEKPYYVLTNTFQNVRISFTVEDYSLEEDQIDLMIMAMERSLKGTGLSGLKILKKHPVYIHHKKFGYIKIRYDNVYTGMISNTLFFTWGGKMGVIIFDYPEIQKKYWKKYEWKILSSIRTRM